MAPAPDPKEKHPQRLIVDRTSPADMQVLDGADTKTLWAYNEKGGYQQGDTYVDGTSTTNPEKIAVSTSNVNGTQVTKTSRENSSKINYTTLIASQDYARKETKLIGNVYFETDKTDLNTADSTAALKNERMNDASGYIKLKAAQIATMLTAKGNEKLEVAVIGHASLTGDHDHNQSLSETRAKEVNAALIAEMNKIDPSGKLAARIHQTTEGAGDKDLAVQTSEELKKNRNVSIEVVTQNVMEPDRTYQLVHIDKKDIESIQRLGDGAFTIDLEGSSSAGKELKAKFALNVPVPARGAILLETTQNAKPLDINVSVHEADDFRLLVADTKAKVAYRINEDNSVSVTAGDKTVAVLHYDAKNGPVKPESIRVGTMDAHGLTREASRDVEGEARVAVEKQNATRMDLLKAIDIGHDGKIDQGEIAAYEKNAALRTKLGAADTDKNGGVDFQEASTMGRRMLNGMEGPAFSSPTIRTDFAVAVKQVGHLNAGNPEVSKEEMAKARSMDAMFKDILDKGGFDNLKNGPLAFADVAKSLDDVAAQKVTTPSLGKQPTPPQR